jgi:hypothetical protein
MKKTLLTLLCCSILFIGKSFAQSERVVGPAEKKITDSLCVAISRLDMSQINGKKDAEAAFMNCFMKQSAMFEEVANERKIRMDDNGAMHQLGIDIAKNLLKMKCDKFLTLAVKMAPSSEENEESTVTGTFKRIETKGFNYIVLGGRDDKEISFLWLHQFAGSEKFMNGTTAFIGKKMIISYKETEVYLPAAKGYYKLREVASLRIE